MGVVTAMNLQWTSEASCGSSFKGQFPAEVEIQVKEGGTSLNKIMVECTLGSWVAIRPMPGQIVANSVLQTLA